MRSFTLIFFLMVTPLVSAYDGPLRDPSLLERPLAQLARRVRTARVVVADHALLRRDFELPPTVPDQEIDLYRLPQMALMSVTQLRPNGVNTKIETDDHEIEAFRPAGGGRLLVAGFAGGLMDIKGAGALSPRGSSHGLMRLSYALQDYMIQKIVAPILQAEGYKPGVVENYAVIDLGFDLIEPDGSTHPAGLLLRQSSRRTSVIGSLAAHEEQRIESILRRYGLLSDGEALSFEYQTIDRRNVQTVANGALIDFEDYVTVPRGRALKQSPVVPDENLRVAPELDTLESDLEKVARSFRAGSIMPADVEAFLKDRIQPVRSLNCRAAFR